MHFSTGDAAGQNMVSKATDNACRWIMENCPQDIVLYAFSGGMDTDKKHSNINNLYSRGNGASYTGGHSANGIAAFFIATGQDEANVVESHAGQTYTEVRENGDLYWSWTLPSLIVATFGGGTGLPTQRECLEMLDCVGKDKARKLAEIVAAVVAAGDVSIANAIVAHEFVDSHEKYGRNR